MYSYYCIFYILYMLNYVRSHFFLWVYLGIPCIHEMTKTIHMEQHTYYNVCIKYSIVHFAFTLYIVHCIFTIERIVMIITDLSPEEHLGTWTKNTHCLHCDALGWGEHTWSPSSPLPVLLLPLLLWCHGQNMREQRCPGKSHPRWQASHSSRGPPFWQLPPTSSRGCWCQCSRATVPQWWAPQANLILGFSIN